MGRERRNGFKIKIPPPEKITPEELERRGTLVEKTLKLRDEIGPVEFSIARTVRAMREGEESD